jgi:hypothetical protein
MEVDFVLARGDDVMALEVKSGRMRSRSGLQEFRKEYPKARVMLIGGTGIPWQEFLGIDTSEIF